MLSIALFNCKQEVKKLQSFVKGKNSLAILENILLYTEDDKIFAYATDLCTSIKIRLMGTVFSEGKIVLKPSLLKDNCTIKEIGGKELEIDTMKAYCSDPEDYPEPPEDDLKFLGTINYKFLFKMLTNACKIKRKDSGSSMNGLVSLEVNNNMLKVCSTCGVALLIEECKTDIENFKAVFLNKDIKKIKSIGAGNVSIFISNTTFKFVGEYQEITLSLVEKEFFDYNKLVNEEIDNVVTVDRKKLIKELKNIKSNFNNESRFILCFNHDSLIISTFNPDIGSMTTTIEYLSAHIKDTVEAFIGIHILLNCLSSFDNNELVMFFDDNKFLKVQENNKILLVAPRGK